ncbi:hypothetical protein [Lysinibacillus sp. G4S2]|uniref:hypothetical protein n=1 Tax=Lysinibacillus sp. G4S2 TaxID=3055859 RepID=UPI0025A22F18|nr:hypothetical protein [Lysinibacillus sp. G4S2]MDM5248727.1 hypothetical protein [Lysinibacillus sp. G4S2]
MEKERSFMCSISACQHQAYYCQNLALELDDFAIREGHTGTILVCMTYDGTILNIILRRTILELEAYFSEQVTLCALKPIAHRNGFDKGLSYIR